MDSVTEYLNRHESKDLLRFLTCGSVDDGKSTLIGRLLFDCHTIYEDQLAALHKDSLAHGTTGNDFDPALLTDGLKAEREQGITIDVAYRYFSTEKRKFIIADTPGHEQYTRNMATGASTCNLAIVLVDARKGVLPQTKRHSFIVSLLGIKHLIVAINKMDLVDWSEEKFTEIHNDFNRISSRLRFADTHFIPISALHGDNIVERSMNTPWYDGPTLLHHLENVNIASDRNLIDLRFPVQYVLRPDLNFRGFAGTLASGVLRKGDEIIVLPSQHRAAIQSIITENKELEEAFAPMSVVVTLDKEIDISRGDMIVRPHNMPETASKIEAMLVWMHEEPGESDATFLLKHTTRTIPATLHEVRYKMDVNTMHKLEDSSDKQSFQMNDIGRVQLDLHRPLAFDSYRKNPVTGSFILINRLTNATVAAGMILNRVVSSEQSSDKPVSQNITKEHTLVADSERQHILKQKGATIWLTGLSGSGKSTIAKALEKRLIKLNHAAFILDGDNIRHRLNRDLGFSATDRSENIRRIAEVAALFNDAGLITLTAFISPYRDDRKKAQEIIGSDRFMEVYIDTPVEVCEQRDPKGLYKKARSGEIPNFTGITDPYEAPVAPFMKISTANISAEEAAENIITELLKLKILFGVESSS